MINREKFCWLASYREGVGTSCSTHCRGWCAPAGQRHVFTWVATGSSGKAETKHILQPNQSVFYICESCQVPDINCVSCRYNYALCFSKVFVIRCESMVVLTHTVNVFSNNLDGS